MPASRRILVSGYYGFGNAGDEAVLAGMIETLRRESRGAASVCVLSGNPDETRRRHGVEALDRMDPRAMNHAIERADLFLSGGGSLLQDTTSLRSLLYYLWVIRKAVIRGVPAVLYAQGIGPLRRQISRALVRSVSNRVRAITVRDEGSALLLRKIGVNRPPVEVTADPAFALEPAGDPGELRKRAGLAEGQTFVAVALRPWKAPVVSAEQLAIMAMQCAEEAGGTSLLLPMQWPGDAELAEQIADLSKGKAMMLRRELSPGETITLLGEAEAVVAMRLHTLIFAAAASAPVMSLAYDPKVASLMQELGQEDANLQYSVESVRNMPFCLRSVLDNASDRRAAIRLAAGGLRQRALRTAGVALGVLEGKAQ